MIRVGILTISDKGARGEREDKSGEVIKDMLGRIGAKIESYEIIPDEKIWIEERLINLSDKLKLDLILTTGGTGFSPRDVTPEATLAVIEREAPGLAEVMRTFGMKRTPRAMLSRAVAGIRKKSLIINLPGSPQAVKEGLEAIFPALEHGIEILRQKAVHKDENGKVVGLF